jgi:hypothetical protein
VTLLDVLPFLPYTAPAETFSVCGAQQDLYPGSRRLTKTLPNAVVWEGHTVAVRLNDEAARRRELYV